MPIVCAHLPSCSVAFARRDDPALAARATIVVDRLERGHVVDADAAARDAGVRAGMTLVQAAACARDAAIVVDDPARNRARWDEILDALDAASPLVEDRAIGTALVEMRGIEGTPERWIASVQDALATQRLPFAFALASTPFAACTAARIASDGACIVAPGAEAAFLAPLGLAALELERDVEERLHLLGIRTLGDLAALPHGPFVRRFGPEAARWHAYARGVDERPLVPRTRALRIDRTLYGEGTAEREEQLLFALRTLVARVADDLVYAGKRCGALHLAIECEDGATREIAVVLAEATAEASVMFALVRARLEGTVLHAPVVGLRLGAGRLDEGGTALSLFAGSDPDPQALAVALARLDAALGEGAAVRARIIEGHRPETRFAYERFVRPAAARRVVTDGGEDGEVPTVVGYRLVATQPIDVRLERGVPVAIAGLPGAVQPRAIAEIAGPWRTAETWWSAPLDRDEYDVGFEDGTLYRVTWTATGWCVCGIYD